MGQIRLVNARYGVLSKRNEKIIGITGLKAPPFGRGMNDGVLWYFHGNTPCCPVTEEDVVDLLQGNVVALVEVGLLQRRAKRLNHINSSFLGGEEDNRNAETIPVHPER